MLPVERLAAFLSFDRNILALKVLWALSLSRAHKYHLSLPLLSVGPLIVSSLVISITTTIQDVISWVL